MIDFLYVIHVLRLTNFHPMIYIFHFEPTSEFLLFDRLCHNRSALKLVYVLLMVLKLWGLILICSTFCVLMNYMDDQLLHPMKIVNGSFSIICSMGIQSVVDDKNIEKTSNSLSDAGCTVCEMAVVWIKNQLRLNETEEQILDYVTSVNHSPYLCYWRRISNVLSGSSYSLVSNSLLHLICSSVISFPAQMENQ